MDKRVPPSSSLEQFWSRRNGQKSARELRQGGSDYRCCIPVLAGFVSPQSIVPDGDRLFAKDCLGAIVFSTSASARHPGARLVPSNCEMLSRVFGLTRLRCLQHFG